MASDPEALAEPEPWLPLFEVRAELDKVTDVRYFDRWVELALARAERDGNMVQFRKDLRGHLSSALIGQNQELVVGTPYEDRTAVINRLVEEWMAQHPPHTSFRL